MEFKVPKFLEREIRFFNVLTFKQLGVVGGAGLILVIIYYLAPKSVFFISLLVIGGILFGILFVRIEGVPLPQLVGRTFGFLFSSKNYFWQKKEVVSTAKLIKLKEEKSPKEKKETSLKIAPQSRLKKLSSKIEMGLR